jgi:asparagine synthase (glutamine-hydrolysing)
MCGICGHIGPGASEEAVSRTVAKMNAALARRGPDSEGLATWPEVALGHRRLAILDLSDAGRQPMLSDDGQTGLVFNGCIYNFQELRAELEGRGHKFRSQCDTEVILRGYLEWGIDALLRRVRGMFAIGIWDNARRTLTLTRDRLGVKPLVYCVRGAEIAFASTMTALRSAGFGGGVDPDAALDVMEYGWVADHRSIFRGIRKLPPATVLEWKAGEVRERRYWDVPERPETSRISFDDAVEQTEQLLIEAVSVRLVSDVPIGVLLSGGIDSALVCWALRESAAGVKAFTIHAPSDSSDESEAAAKVARRLGIPHETVSMPRTEFSLDELVDAYSEPFACQSAQAMLWVSHAVKSHATVLLTGDGGDDAFFGYPFFWNAWKAQQLARAVPGFALNAAAAAASLLPAKGPVRRVSNFLGYAAKGLAGHVRAHDGLPYLERHSILGRQFSGRELPERRISASHESGRRLLADVFAYHQRMHFTSEFMPKVDGGAMYYAIESRAPFLDQKLWEFASALPAEIHFHEGRLKSVLREIARRRIGPDVAFRKKQGFTVPVEHWLAGRWRGMLEQLLDRTALEGDGWVRPGSLRRPVETALRDGRAPVQLWRLMVFNRWLEKNLHSQSAAGNHATGSPASVLTN